MFDKPPPSPVNVPVVVMLPALRLPDTSNELNVPTVVIFDCTASTTVFAVVACIAFATVPDTLAPSTAFALAAFDTSPVTFAPAILS